MEDVKFNLESIEKTFMHYSKKQIISGKVVSLKNDGAVFDIGGKLDGFIPEKEYPDFVNAKIGDAFSVLLLGEKNNENMILLSKAQAEKMLSGNKRAEILKTGSKFSFEVVRIQNNNLIGYLGEYKIIVPNRHISVKPSYVLGKYLNKKIDVVVLEIDKIKKSIFASIIALKKENQVMIENTFWQNIDVDKIVKGKVIKIMPYGAFVNVDGVDCFIHISDLAYEKVDKVENFLTEGEEKLFKILKVDKENKKILLGLKQMSENVKLAKLKALEIGKIYKGTVTKILPFGALIVLNENIEGLLHIADTNEPKKRIYEIVKPGQEIDIAIKSVDLEKERVALSCILTNEN